MAVTITTTGATFSPVTELASGSTATITWSCPGFTSQNGVAPSFAFGSAATRTVTMTVTGGGGYADITAFDLGYDNTIDVGRSMPPARFVKTAEAVTGGIGGLNSMTGLIYFLADHTALNSALDFTGMSALQYIQCYGTNITGVTLTGCTALVRLQVEASNLTSLDLNPVAGNLGDLRAAIQQGGSLALAALTAPMAAEYHYCVRDQRVTGPIPTSRLPVIYEYWTWNTGLSGALSFSSNALHDVRSYQNSWTAADLSGQITSAGGHLDLHGCQLTDVDLSGCTGLSYIDLSDNRLTQGAVDDILAVAASWGTSGGTLSLLYNTPPSATGTAAAATLTGRGWTVSTDSPAGISVVQTSLNGSDFTTGAGTGDTVIMVVCAYSHGNTPIGSTAPLYNGATPPGTVKLQEVMSPFNVDGNASYHAVWMMPHCGTGSPVYLSPGITGGSLIDFYALDVAGLGVFPVADRQATGSNANSTAMDSGATRAVRSGPQLIIGASQTYPGAAAGPGAPWTVIAGSSSHGWCGYQIAASPGGTYEWAQTSAGGDPWTAGVVTVAVSLAGSGLLMASFP